MAGWIDTHVHMDDSRFSDAHAVRQAARDAGVERLVIPAIGPVNFTAVRELAHAWGDAYALGIHPMYLPADADATLAALEQELVLRQHDPHLVAMGEIGLDFFEPHLCTPAMREVQAYYFSAQLRLARRFGLPVILHVRRSVDAVFKHLRQTPPPGGIAHAFVGSLQQAQQAVDLGLKLGFGGAMTFDRATRLQELARTLPLEAIVLETDAPDIAPDWLYVTAEERRKGKPQACNSPVELPRIGHALAALRGVPVDVVREATTANAYAVLPRLLQEKGSAPSVAR
ncbi:MAG: TatD family hydrolase [Brachymonas sp.]|nr:TatD family hydrolase [Brachymonas sp.]